MEIEPSITHHVFYPMLNLALHNATEREEFISHLNRFEQFSSLHTNIEQLKYIETNFLGTMSQSKYLSVATPLLCQSFHDLTTQTVTILAMGIRNYISAESGEIKVVPISVVTYDRNKEREANEKHAKKLQKNIDRVLEKIPQLSNRIVTCLITDGSPHLQAYKELSICKNSAVNLTNGGILHKKLLDASISESTIRRIFKFGVGHLDCLMTALNRSQFHEKFDSTSEDIPLMDLRGLLKLHETLYNHTLGSTIRAGVVPKNINTKWLDYLRGLLVLRRSTNTSPQRVIQKILKLVREWHYEMVMSAVVGSSRIICQKMITSYEFLSFTQQHRALVGLGLKPPSVYNSDLNKP